MKLDSLPTEAGAASVAPSGRDNQNSDRTSTDSTFPAGIPFGLAYNVPDGFEEDQEIIRSEMMFFNTPLTEKYSAEVYGAVRNIQDQCTADYQAFCPTSASYMNLNSLMAQLLIPMDDQRIFRGRRLKSSELKTGADYVGYLRSFYAPFNLHLLGNTHPLSAAVYRDPETGKFKAVESTRERMPVPNKEIKATKPETQQVQVRSHVHSVPKTEHHHHHGRRLSEEAKGNTGRKAAPGWKPPASASSSEPSNKAIKPTNPDPQVQAQAQAQGHHATANSYAHTVRKVEHHDHMHRQLRVGAPGWHQPPAPAAVPGVRTVVAPPPMEKKASEDHHYGRMAAPGWKQPVAASEPSDKAIKPTNPEPQAQGQGPPRALRTGAPGWHQPPSVTAAASEAAPLVGGPAVDVMAEETSEAHIEPAFLKSLDDTQELPRGVAGPCSKPFQGQAGQQPLSVAGFRPTSLFFSPGGFFFHQQQQQVAEGQDQLQQQGQVQGQAAIGSDFRSFILDFLSGRDASLSLATSNTTPLTTSVQHRANKQRASGGDDDSGVTGDDEADAATQDDGSYYSYYSYDDDGANYSYDDALFLTDDDDRDAVDDATGADDDDFFAQRFFLPPNPPSLPAAADAAKPLVGPLKLTVRPSSDVHSRLAQRVAARREHKEEGGASSEEEEEEEGEDEGEDSDGSGDEKNDHEHHGDDNHKHEHRHSTKVLKGIKARLSSLVHGKQHNSKHANSQQHMEMLDHHDREHDHHDRPERGGGDRDKGDHDHDRDHHHDHHDHDGDRDDPRNGGPHGPPKDDDRDPDTPSHRGPPPPPPHHPPLPPVPEDHSFSGNLGFGADGDMCVYRAMSQGRVSQPCVGAVSELYELRAQYWEESQQPQDFHHHHGLGLLILGVVLLACTVRRIYAIRYEKKVRSLLTALHTHPHLKSSIEAETGVEVPVPVPAGTCCVGANTDGNSSGVTLVKAGKVLAFAVLIFAVSFAVSFSSLEITMHVVNEMDKHAPEDPNTGEPAFTSPLAALFVLFFVCTAELTVLALLVRGVKACFKRRAEASAAAASASISSSPSAPFDPRGPSSRSSRLSQHAQQILASLPPALFGRPRPQQAADGYSPLLGEESMHGGHEMTSVRMSAYPAQHASQQAQQGQQDQQYVPVYVPVGPVTASPIGVHSINMV